MTAHDLVAPIVLGLTQGITEFLPISSDGHLVILGHLLGVGDWGLPEVVLLHLGSLAAVLWVFRADLLALLPRRPPAGEGWRPLGLLAVACLPAAVVGPLAHGLFQSAFDAVRLSGAFLILNGLVLLATRWFDEGGRRPGFATALAMGVAQVFAMLPGLSRSALTLAAGFGRGGDRIQVMRFSFVMAVPAILGAGAFEIARDPAILSIESPEIALGIVVAFLSGLVAIRLLTLLVRRGRFEWFGIYCIAVGAAVVVAA